MTKETRSDAPEMRDTLAESQRDLQHQLIRALVEAPEGTYDLPHLAELRAVAERRARGEGLVRSRGGDAVAIDFAVKVITEAMASLIADFDFLRHPAKGFVSWYNDTDAYVHVLTFDQDDAVRWVPYEDRIVAPRQVVKITARGDRIHVKTVANNATYDCDKGQAYLFSRSGPRASRRSWSSTGGPRRGSSPRGRRWRAGRTSGSRSAACSPSTTAGSNDSSVQSRNSSVPP